MARSRKPTAIHELSGAFAKNPNRAEKRLNEPIPQGEIGEAPPCLTVEQAQVWDQFVAECPTGVLKSSDRFALENFCRIQARIRAGTAELKDEAQARIFLQQFGMTPASRSNVQVAPEDSGNEFADAAAEAKRLSAS